MQTLELIGKRIDTTQDLQSIVRTMKSLSAVSIRQYEVAEAAVREYHRTIELGLQIALQAGPPVESPEPGHEECIAMLLFGSDLGLCGRFNDQIVDYALEWVAVQQDDRKSFRWLTVGSRATARLQSRGAEPAATYSLPGSIHGLSETVGAVLGVLDQWRGEGVIDRAVIFHNRRKKLGSSSPRMRRLWPPDPSYLRALAHQRWDSRSSPMFTMDRAALLSVLIRQHLFVSIFQAGAESMAAEHAARLSAMQSAERNIAEKLQEMQFEHRRARQDAITAELLDIIAGSEALRSS
ncbi:MAG: F0F1 ATP synthase subunit gamma [Hyphomicrobiaceae bacterium]